MGHLAQKNRDIKSPYQQVHSGLSSLPLRSVQKRRIGMGEGEGESLFRYFYS